MKKEKKKKKEIEKKRRRLISRNQKCASNGFRENAASPLHMCTNCTCEVSFICTFWGHVVTALLTFKINITLPFAMIKLETDYAVSITSPKSV